MVLEVVTASEGKTACIWDVQTGQQIHILEVQQWSVQGATFSPDRTRVITASEDNSAKLWDANTGPRRWWWMVVGRHEQKAGGTRDIYKYVYRLRK